MRNVSVGLIPTETSAVSGQRLLAPLCRLCRFLLSKLPHIEYQKHDLQLAPLSLVFGNKSYELAGSARKP